MNGRRQRGSNITLLEPMWCSLLWYSFPFLTAVLYIILSMKEGSLNSLSFFFPIVFSILKLFNLRDLLSEYVMHNNMWWSPLGNVCYVKKRFHSMI